MQEDEANTEVCDLLGEVHFGMICGSGSDSKRMAFRTSKYDVLSGNGLCSRHWGSRGMLC